MVKAIVVAGTHSGAGKTLVSIGLMAVLKKMGYMVQPFKVGPDYIDPGYHFRVTGNVSYNLDGWMMGRDAVCETFFRHIKGKDIAVIEGVMGLFDGRSGVSEEGSTAEISRLLGVPVLLVVDAKGMARSAAAVLKGFESFDETEFAGAVFNKTGGERHNKYITEAVEAVSGMKLLGFLPREKKLEIESRHLGLLMSEERVSGKLISTLVDWIEKNVDIKGILTRANCTKPVISVKRRPLPRFSFSRPCKIAVAADRAFSFYYEENLDYLRAQGAELLFFSPLSDKRVPEGTDIVYLGGGYPELFALELEANSVMRENITAYAEAGGKVYAECGGLIYLCGRVRVNGKEFKMAGVFPFDVVMTPSLQALGYLDVETVCDTPLFRKGTRIRGHQFRYSRIEGEPDGVKMAYRVEKRADNTGFAEGYVTKNVLGSYIHLHFSGMSQ